MNDILDPILDATAKGFPQTSPPLRRSAIGQQGWNVLAGDLPLPLAVIRSDALSHNIGWMQRFVEEAGIGLAPHGKTTMSPQLFRRQLDAGAWGLTFATVGQARIGVMAGARRCLIANQVMHSADLAGIQAMRLGTPGLQVVFLVDSLAQLQLIEAHAASQAGTDFGDATPEPFDVLIEVGLPGGRTGCRHADAAWSLAHAVHASAAVRLVGIECYEGLAATGDDAHDRDLADGLMQRVVDLARRCDAEDLFDSDSVILSAGGSSIFDLVVPGLRARLRRPVQGLLRSGCYVTHDHGSYQRMVARLNHRQGCDDGLRAAIEVWAIVQSQPEPGLALLAVGKRDLSFDMGLPTPVALCRRGEQAVEAAPSGWTVTGLNDQHAYLRLDEGAEVPRVGDLVALGISHPCTTFDKWRWMPVVDADYRVIDALVTCF